MTRNFGLIFLITITLGACGKKQLDPSEQLGLNSLGQPVHQDLPYTQTYGVKYYLEPAQQHLELEGISRDRNENIRILSNQGLLMPGNGSMMYPGVLEEDISYGPLKAKKISALITSEGNTIYLDDKQIFSNAWAGKIQIDHDLPKAKVFARGKEFQFLVADQQTVSLFDQDSKKLWSEAFDNVTEIIYEEKNNRFILVSPELVSEFTQDHQINPLYEGKGISSAALFRGDLIIATQEGYLFLSDKKLIGNVPWPEITVVKEINDELWFGTNRGAFKLNENGTYSYYAGERWLPGDQVKSLESGPEKSILVLTEKGLGNIIFEEMTLEDKAMFYEKQVRAKNIRYGINNSNSAIPNGYASAAMSSQPSDNLWTGMYLVSQLYRYKVTGSEDAKINAFEAFEAMERFHTITNIQGLFARSFERDYIVINTKEEGWEKKELLSGSPAKIWMPGADHQNWTWRSTASSDQAVGQVFALTTILELVEDEDWRNRALKCLDDMMGYIVDNDMYIIDVDGEPTLWGKWNPDYVNGFPVNVGDRRLYSSNIIAFLQAAYHYTGKEKYKTKAYELMEKNGYLENLTRPIQEIGPSDADEWSKQLSHSWNHSDDEMYFLAYPSLFQHAFTPELKEQYVAAIKDHWMVERPEKNALWNMIYASTGEKDIDLEESVWFLQNYPMDLRNWSVQNSHRKDISVLPTNFRDQTTTELLPLGETPLHRHNGNIFKLDQAGNGDALISAGDVWLLPYWMGRYYGLISAPVAK